MDGFFDTTPPSALTPDDAARLIRYVVGDLPSDEHIATSAWIAADPARQAYAEQLGAAWQAVPERAPRTYDVEAALARAKGRMRPVHIPAVSKADIPRRRWWIAASVGVVAVVLAVVTLPKLRRLTDGPPRIVASREYATANAQRSQITFEDGSSAVLAPSTRLRYTRDAAGARVVELSGEALFSVAPHTDRPFVVRTGTVHTRVLGTVFDVRRYPEEKSTQVAVLSGRVATGNATPTMRPTVLVAGAVGVVTDSSVSVSANESERVASWTQGHLIFRNTDVATVLATLQRWYGYEFRLTDSTMAAARISVGLSTEQPAEALQMLKKVLGVTMTFDANVITLRPTHDRAAKALERRMAPLNTGSEVGR